MKQAILITAYKNLEQVKRIIERFDSDFEFFVHIDKKCHEDTSILKLPNVHLFKKYKIYWGSGNHLKAILFLLSIASKYHFHYYHLITGADYPIKSASEFKHFFNEKNTANYLEFHKLPRVSWGTEGGLDRIKYYWIGNSIFDIRGSFKRITYLLIKIQRKLKINRRFFLLFPSLWGGGTYWSLTDECVKYLLDYCSSKDINRDINYTHCSEEIIIHTIILNSSNRFEFENNSLRYIVWEGTSQSPNILTRNDFENMANSGCFFARKMDPFESSTLLAKIDKEINKL